MGGVLLKDTVKEVLYRERVRKENTILTYHYSLILPVLEFIDFPDSSIGKESAQLRETWI